MSSTASPPKSSTAAPRKSSTASPRKLVAALVDARFTASPPKSSTASPPDVVDAIRSRNRASACAIICAGLLAASVAHASPSDTRIEVPDGVYTVLHFAQPVAKAVLPPGAPVKGKPYFLSHNTDLLLMFTGHKDVQAVIQLADGSTHVLDLHPSKGASPRIDVPDTAPGHPASEIPAVPASRNPAAGVIPILSGILIGKVPDGWSPGDPGDLPVLRYDRLTAHPAAVWRDGAGERVIEYRLDARDGKHSVLDASQFYRSGVKAALLTENRVSPGHPGTLYLVTGGSDGR